MQDITAEELRQFESMDRKEKVYLYCMGVLNCLKECGIIDGTHELTFQGKRQYYKLLETDFKPTEEELYEVMQELTGFTHISILKTRMNILLAAGLVLVVVSIFAHVI